MSEKIMILGFEKVRTFLDGLVGGGHIVMVANGRKKGINADSNDTRIPNPCVISKFLVVPKDGMFILTGLNYFLGSLAPPGLFPNETDPFSVIGNKSLRFGRLGFYDVLGKNQNGEEYRHLTNIMVLPHERLARDLLNVHGGNGNFPESMPISDFRRYMPKDYQR
jgi:hypothetical protein